MGRLDGRAAIVTGASMGIGEGIARVLAREGARVALADVADAEGERVAEDFRNQGADAFFVHAYQNVAATSPYAASKGGVVALTRTMAIDFARDGIRVNAVCPGWIETPLTRRIFAESGDFEGMRRQVAERQLLGRLGTPEDVGHAVAYLASDEASFVTGASLFVDAGLTAQLETW